MRKYIYSLMTDKRSGFVASLVKGVLLLASFFYGGLIKVIRPIKIFTAKKLPCKVVSVGNLTLGGTGKTPTACRLAKFLKEEGHQPAVLIRGYGDDEWKMLKALLGDIPIIVGRNRVASGKEALSKFKVDTIVLDDGFQHWRLKRDLDMVLIDSTSPFGNKRLFPRGILREDINDLKRANIIMLTKTDMGKSQLKEIKSELRNIVPHTPILESIHSPLGFDDLTTRERLNLSLIRDTNICSLSSIVNTKYFEYMLDKLGANIVSRFHYPDHYNYKFRDLESIISECKSKNIDTIVTTQKDAVKLDAYRRPSSGIRIPKRNTEYGIRNTVHDIRILVLPIELKVTDGERILKERLHSLYSG